MCKCKDRLFNSKVIDSRKQGLKRLYIESIYRRRQCKNCGDKFSTEEKITESKKTLDN